MSEPVPVNGTSLSLSDAPVDYENLGEDDYQRYLEHHARRLAALEATLESVIDLATVRSNLDALDPERLTAIYDPSGEVQPLIRDAVLDLHDAWAELQGRFPLHDEEPGDPWLPSHLAFDWAGRVLDATLGRAGYVATLTREPDGRFIHRY
jgi:hypothetical protein